MRNGVLTGYAIHIATIQAEHTYVTSNAGHVWPCGGRDTGGQSICQGSGNVDLAMCLAEPNSFAGIIYGVTGLCHQMANRILYPAALLVTAARGYKLSKTIYGDYGTHPIALLRFDPVLRPWPQLIACTLGRGPSRKAYIESRMDAEGGFIMDTVRHTEFRSMAEDCLGSSYDSNKLDQVEILQTTLICRQGDLRRQLNQRTLNPECYVDELNKLTSCYASQCEAILGTTDYLSLFELTPDEAGQLIDKATFLRLYDTQNAS